MLVGVAAAMAAAAERPNIVLIISDDHGFPDYGFMGSPHVRTPNIDRLASAGLTFTRGYVTTALCSPSLATLLTGLYPHQHGITGNDLYAPKDQPDAGGMRGNRRPLTERLLANPLLLPRELAKAGYRSLQTGKLWNAGYADVGFTDGMIQPGGRHGGEGLSIGRHGLRPIFDFIDAARAEQRPFFVGYAPFLPHTPHTPPDRLLAKYAGKGPTPAAEKYFAMVEWLDETCGELDAFLRERGMFENTLVVHVADNGWSADEGDTSPRAKRSPYELGVRTPIVIRWAGRVEPRRDETTLASVVDVVPTILAAAGLPVPSSLPGCNLIDRPAVEARAAVFLENYGHDIMDIANPAASLLSRGVVSGPWKLLVASSGTDSVVGRKDTLCEPVELYDLERDPLERDNLAGCEPDRVAELRRRLDAWWNPSSP